MTLLQAYGPRGAVYKNCVNYVWQAADGSEFRSPDMPEVYSHQLPNGCAVLFSTQGGDFWNLAVVFDDQTMKNPVGFVRLKQWDSLQHVVFNESGAYAVQKL